MIEPKLLFVVSFIALCVLEYIRPSFFTRKEVKMEPLPPKTLETLFIKTYRQEPDGSMTLLEALPKMNQKGEQINKRGGSKMKHLRLLHEPGMVNRTRLEGVSSHN